MVLKIDKTGKYEMYIAIEKDQSGRIFTQG